MPGRQRISKTNGEGRTFAGAHQPDGINIYRYRLGECHPPGQRLFIIAPIEARESQQSTAHFSLTKQGIGVGDFDEECFHPVLSRCHCGDVFFMFKQRLANHEIYFVVNLMALLRGNLVQVDLPVKQTKPIPQKTSFCDEHIAIPILIVVLRGAFPG